MANSQPTQYDQQNHIPSFSDIPRPAGQRQNAAQPDANSAIQCSCPSCSVTRHSDPPVRRTMEYQNPWFPGVGTIYSDVAISYSDFSPPKGAVVPFTDRNIGANHPTGIAAMTNGQTQFVAPQHPDATGYEPLHEQTRPPQVQTGVGLDQAQVFNMLVMESLRQAARHYVNHPESLVNAVRLEPGAAGRFRVVIILEVTDILWGWH